jgi:hypothetical protein
MPRSDRVVRVRWSTLFDVVVVVVVFVGSEVQPSKVSRLLKARQIAINVFIPRLSIKKPSPKQAAGYRTKPLL